MTDAERIEDIRKYALAAVNAFCNNDVTILLRALDAANEQIDAAMKVLDPAMPESGIEDAARQVKQVAITEADNCNILTERLREAEEALRDIRSYKSWQAIYTIIDKYFAKRGERDATARLCEFRKQCVRKTAK